MALLRHRRYGPRFSSATAGARVCRELPEMPHASDEIRQVLVVRQLKPQGETAFHHTDTARRTLLRRYAPRSPARLEHGLELAGRARDYAEYLRCRGLLLQRLG